MKTKFTLSIGFLVLLALFSFRRGAQLYKVRGSITQTNSYCGGAYMPDQIELAKKPVPYPSKTIYVKESDKNSMRLNVIKEFTSDKDGNFEVDLPSGTYCLLEEYKSKRASIPRNDKYTTWDSACIINHWKTCDYVLTVWNENVKNLVINYHHDCSYSQPCQIYKGPLPPSAAH